MPCANVSRLLGRETSTLPVRDPHGTQGCLPPTVAHFGGPFAAPPGGGPFAPCGGPGGGPFTCGGGGGGGGAFTCGGGGGGALGGGGGGGACTTGAFGAATGGGPFCIT